MNEGQASALICLVEADQFELHVSLTLPVLLPGPKLPGADQVIGTRLSSEVKQASTVSSNFWADTPHMIGVVVHEVQPTFVLIDWFVIVLAPQVVVTKFVTLLKKKTFDFFAIVDEGHLALFIPYFNIQRNISFHESTITK